MIGGAGKLEIIARHFHETTIGLELDMVNKRVLVTYSGGNLYSVDVGTGAKEGLFLDMDVIRQLHFEE